MPVLDNPRHEKVAQVLALGDSSQVDAIEQAGYVPHRGNASRLISNESVKARIGEIQAQAADITKFKRADILRMMAEDRELARANDQASAAIRATELLGMELASMFVRKSESGDPGEFRKLSDAQVTEEAATIADKLGLHEVASRLRASTPD